MSDMQYQGRFVWRDLMSSDIEKTKAFYTDLFGWTAEGVDMGGGYTYTLLKRDGEQFGGLSPLEPEYGIPSHWVSYVTTDNVDDFCAKASEMGATVTVQPMDIPNVGRFAIVGDAQGAFFSPFTEANPAPIVAPRTIASHGEVAWNELATGDVEGSKAFYTKMFGLESEVMDVGTGPYTLLKNSGTPVAGVMPKQPDMPVSAWVVYFEVSDIDAAVERVAELGGQTLFPPMQVPTVGRLTWVTDPMGATFAIIQSEPPKQ